MKNIILVLSLAVLSSGCGYTGSSLLPDKYDSVHVKNFVNKIDPAAEVSDRRMSYTYFPGMENQITAAIIDRFMFDRHITVTRESDASMILEGELMDYRQFPLSYDKDENVEEMRSQINVSLALYDGDTGEIIWREGGFTGWASYDLTGPNAATEAEGLNRAIDDLARRVVERVLEVW